MRGGENERERERERDYSGKERGMYQFESTSNLLRDKDFTDKRIGMRQDEFLHKYACICLQGHFIYTR